ncbi:MAG: alpha-ketoglutarate-dependent dioxygenase AlkB [Pseudomonadales bacterium]
MQPSLFSSSPQLLDLPNADIGYYETFIDNQQDYFERLQCELQWSQDTIQLYGRPVLIPRLNAWYGDKDAAYRYSGLDLLPLSWTNTLLTLKTAVEALLGTVVDTPFNSVLASYYRDGSDSVAWHSDDEAELGTNPVIASLSFGAMRRFSFRNRNAKNQHPIHLDLVGGSLLVMAGSTQRYWHHQIPKTTTVLGGRINLTFRRIVTTITDTGEG